MPSAVMDSFLLQLVILLACVTWSGTTTKLFIGANWKCSLESVEDVDRQVESLNNMWSSLDKAEKDAIELCINPSFVYLDRVRTKLHKEISVGRQKVLNWRAKMAEKYGPCAQDSAKTARRCRCCSSKRKMGEHRCCLRTCLGRWGRIYAMFA
jgi:hypothetical protein